MARFEVSAPLGELVFSHTGRTLTVSGDPDAVRDWKHRYRRVLYGAFGHIFKEKDCALSDVSAMLMDAYGSQRVKTGSDVSERVRRELRSIPKGAIP